MKMEKYRCSMHRNLSAYILLRSQIVLSCYLKKARAAKPVILLKFIYYLYNGIILHTPVYCCIPLCLSWPWWRKWLSRFDGHLWICTRRDEAHCIVVESFCVDGILYTILQREVFYYAVISSIGDRFSAHGFSGRHDHD